MTANASSGKYADARGRWAGLGPYYAMFPGTFADEVIHTYSKPGDTVLDPFAGRGTALFSAVSAGRKAFGIEVNPVGWIYSKTKLKPAPRDKVEARFVEVRARADRYNHAAHALPEFFHHCYSKNVRAFLISARTSLKWQEDDVDRTAMAFLLTHLHGKVNDSLSNQMRQTKAMSPRYAIDWWRERNMKPPDIAPEHFLSRKLEWRYAKGTPESSHGVVALGDSSALLPRLKGKLRDHGVSRPSLMLTSPPYFDITNYHYDQWIRLWLLGGPPTPQRAETEFKGKHRGKFSNLEVYRSLLKSVFESSAELLKRDAIVYVRTDWREPTVSITRQVLKDAFPRHQLTRRNRPLRGETQTRLFGHHAPTGGEVDLILHPR